MQLRRQLKELYFGDTPRGVRFRVAWILLDLAIIAFFIATPLIRDRPIFLVADYTIALLLAADLAARAYAWHDLPSFLRRPVVWLDLIVLLTLIFPAFFFNFGFLRILRLWTLFNSDIFWRTIARRYDNTRVEDVSRAVATLVTAVFVMTGFVYASFARTDPKLQSYVDALYFTVSTLTTTGYGDIVLPGSWGRLLSIIMMIVGITSFLRIAQAIFRPYKVHFRCPKCGLGTHDPDAVYCKACGQFVNIPNEDE